MSVTKVEFERSVHRGLGRAVLWLLSGEIIPDRDFLLYACTHNLAFDRQTEDNRALYMFDIIYATHEPEFYARAVKRTLAGWKEAEEDDENPVSIYQMFDLLGLLAKRGDLSARQAAYSFFEKHAQSDAIREEVLVEIDGLDGYLFVIRQWLQYPQPEDDDQRFDYLLLDKVDKQFGRENVQKFLERAAQDNPAIGAYLANVREKHAAWKARLKSRQQRHWPGYAEIRESIFDTKKRYSPMMARYGEHLPAADAEQMAREALAETDPKRLAHYLLLFKRRPFPLDHDPLLTLAQDACQDVATAARAALAQIEHPSVRALALELMPDSLRPWEPIEMLTKNFCIGDERAIERILDKTWDADEMHWLTLDTRRLAEANLRPELTNVLMRLYKEGYCTMCRHGVIELLAGLGPLPKSFVEECRHDAYDATRDFVGEQQVTDGAA